MTATTGNANAEKEIRALIDRWVEASRAKDIEAIFTCYSPDVLAFDAIGKLQFQGGEAYRKHWEDCFSHMQGEMLYEVHDLDVVADGGVAFCHYLARCGGTDQNGKEHSGWLRATVCCRKTGGKWVVVHEHFSTPFDPESGKALFDLAPEETGQASAA